MSKKPIKAHTGEHVAQEPHTAAECKINEAPHNHPSTDCGHYVPYGPATGVSDPDNDKYHADQDTTHGPGVKQ